MFVLFKSRGTFLCFNILNVQIFLQQDFSGGHETFSVNACSLLYVVEGLCAGWHAAHRRLIGDSDGALQDALRDDGGQIRADQHPAVLLASLRMLL